MSNRRRTAIAATVAALLAVGTGAAAGFVSLPSDGSQVNNDPTAGIDPTKSVDFAAVVGGALDPTKVGVPWAAFMQETSGMTQIFVRSFNGTSWVTRGSGTVNGLGQTTFPGSLNFDQTTSGEDPSIDFAGTGRAVPWASWYEPTTSLGGKEQIFASRFDNTSGHWVFAGQSRTGTGQNPPSLNIDTTQDAEDPVVHGGSTNASAAPGPWVTWMEEANNGTTTTDQIFVSKPVKLDTGVTTCPVGTKPTGGTAVGGFCWQQVGAERVTSNTKPSLNVDIKRVGLEPDITFTGPSLTVPWVVWYEEGSGKFGTQNQLVFAAKAVSDSGAGVDGGFHWQPVGNGTSGQTQSLDGCVATQPIEQTCSLNKDPAKDALDPRVAAGTMTPGGNTVPWVVWDEDVNGVHQVFVSRLVGGDHFEIANSGQPISLGANNSSNPDITFSGNTPYVSWREQISGSQFKAFYGHFVNAANPTFVLDDPGGTNVSSNGLVTDVRPPISSGCTAELQTGSGGACQGGAIGSPFFLLVDGDPLAKLFAQAYTPDAPVTGSASGLTAHGTVNPEGGPAEVHFDYGTDPNNYDHATAAQLIGPANGDTAFQADLTGFPVDTVIHYRASARGDFGTLTGADQTVQVTGPPSATTGSASGLTPTGATLGGTVVAHGLATTDRFVYGTTTAYGSSTPDVNAGSGTTSVNASATISGLQPGTTYHFAVQAHNDAGTTTGNDATFTTPLRRHTLDVSITGPGRGSVTGLQISCPADCSGNYASGTLVTLTAHPRRGSRFAGWSGACSGRGTCPLKLSVDRSVSARFTRIPPPDTRITGLAVRGRKATVRFRALGGTGRSTFACKLDRGSFRPCRSPKTYRGLKPGRHTVQVRAKDSLGRKDPTPARRSFRVRR